MDEDGFFERIYSFHSNTNVNINVNEFIQISQNATVSDLITKPIFKFNFNFIHNIIIFVGYLHLLIFYIKLVAAISLHYLYFLRMNESSFNYRNIDSFVNLSLNQSISDGNFVLNPSASIFCPTSKVKCVSRFNDFPKNFNLVYANLQGMFEACHFDEFKHAISKSKYISCMAVVETWLRHGVNQNKTCAIAGYKIFRSDRHSKKGDRNKGGGVAIYIADGLKANVLERSFKNNHDILNVDFIFIEVLTKFSKILICCVYRTSKCNKTNTEKLFELINETSSIYDNTIIIGDFNLDILNSTSMFGSLTVNLKIVNHFCPTHFWPGARPSLIDIAFAKNIERFQFFAHFNLIPSTHHDLIMLSYKLKNFTSNNCKTSFSFNDYSKIDGEKLIDEARNIVWNDIIYHLDLFGNNVPVTNVRINHKTNNWFNRDLNIMINERKRLYDIYITYRREQNNRNVVVFARSEYLNQCKRVKNYINYLKRTNFENDLKKSKSCKDYWRVIKDTGCSKENSGINLSHNFDINLLNDHYVNIHSSHLSTLPFRKSYNLYFEFKQITIDNLKCAIKRISSNAIGHDGISIKFLKMIREYFMDAIIDIFNHSIENMCFPEIWNIIKIMPIEKKNEPSSPADTRPITINGVLTKILCSILNDQVRNFIESNNIISEFQSGFRCDHSCMTALVKVTDDVRKSIRSNRVVIMVLFDIKSAYPSVSYELLLYCLKKIGFCERALSWVSCFISNKKQYVSIENSKSNLSSIDCGLLQGDNLSQTFFTIVINEIVDVINYCKMHLYADDLMIYADCDFENLNETITMVNEDVANINKWVLNHGMNLNPIKTQAILISTPANNAKIADLDSIDKIIVDSTEILFCSGVKYLGFYFNNEFSSSDHINNIVRKVNFSLSKIAHCRRFAPKEAKIRIVKNVISPVFDYGSIIYHGHGIHGTGEEEKRLQMLQNSCIRYIFNLPKYEHISSHLRELGLLNLFNRRIFLIACFIHKYLHFFTPQYLNSLLIVNNNNTRAGQNERTFVVGRAYRVRDEHIFNICVSKLWNKLPSEIRCIDRHSIFRIELNKYLLGIQNN